MFITLYVFLYVFFNVYNVIKCNKFYFLNVNSICLFLKPEVFIFIVYIIHNRTLANQRIK